MIHVGRVPQPEHGVSQALQEALPNTEIIGCLFQPLAEPDCALWGLPLGVGGHQEHTDVPAACLVTQTGQEGEKRNHCIFQNLLLKQRVTTPRQLGEIKRQGCLLLGQDGAGDNPKGAEQSAQHLKLAERGQAEQGHSDRANLDIQPHRQLPDSTPSSGRCPVDKYFKLLNLTLIGVLGAVSNAGNSY